MKLMGKGSSRDIIVAQELLPGPVCSLSPHQARQGCPPGPQMPSP